MTFLPSASLPWQTALDIDFSAQSNQTLNVDQNYSIGGFTWTKFNTAQDASAMTLTNGSGIIMTPTSTANIGSSTFNSPGLRIPISSVIPSFTHTMPIRMWIYIPSDNAAAQFDGLYWGTFVQGSGIANQFTLCGYKGFAGGVNGWGSELAVLNSNVTFTTPAVAPSTNKVGVMTYPLGIFGGAAPVETGLTVTGGVWPAFQSLTLCNAAAITAASSGAISSASSGSHLVSDLNFFISAIRAGSVTAYTATVARFRVDYLPTTN